MTNRKIKECVEAILWIGGGIGVMLILHKLLRVICWVTLKLGGWI